MGAESKNKGVHPCQLLFTGLHGKVAPRVTPWLSQGRGSHVPRARSTSLYSNRIMVRSPMVVATPNNRLSTGYFAATMTPCVRGAACAKHGCRFKHPASRATDCPLGINCEDANCAHLHPLHVHGTGAQDAGFAVGQKVQAKFLPNSTKWSDATIHGIRGCALTLQFAGFDDAFEVSTRRVRHPIFTPQAPTPPPRCPLTPPRSPSCLSDLKQLESLKLGAVAREDFVVAAQIKKRITTVKQIAELQQQKLEAVGAEDFMRAMQLKKQIVQLQTDTPKLKPVCQSEQSLSSEVK